MHQTYQRAVVVPELVRRMQSSEGLQDDSHGNRLRNAAALRRVVHDDVERFAIHPLHDQVQDPVLLAQVDRKSTRLNSSHVKISYAVLCLKKKKRKKSTQR